MFTLTLTKLEICRYIGAFDSAEKVEYAKEVFKEERDKITSFEKLREKVKELVSAKFGHDENADLPPSNSKKRKSTGSATKKGAGGRFISEVECEKKIYNVGLFSTEEEATLAKTIFKREMNETDFDLISANEASKIIKTFVQNFLRSSRKGAIDDPNNYHIYHLKTPRKSTKESKDGKYQAQYGGESLGSYASKDDADFAERVYQLRLAMIDDVSEQAAKQERAFLKDLMKNYLENEKIVTSLKRKQPSNDYCRKSPRVRKKTIVKADDVTKEEEKGDKPLIAYSEGSFSLKVWCEGSKDDVYETKKAFSQLLKNRDTSFIVNGNDTDASSTGKISVRKWINGTHYHIGDFETQAEADEALEIFTELRELIDRKTMSKQECDNRINRAIRIARAACTTGKAQNSKGNNAPQENKDASSEGIESTPVEVSEDVVMEDANGKK